MNRRPTNGANDYYLGIPPHVLGDPYLPRLEYIRPEDPDEPLVPLDMQEVEYMVLDTLRSARPRRGDYEGDEPAFGYFMRLPTV
jgi:hypothetical protein